MELCDYQRLLLRQIEDFGERDYATQFHRDLSPAGWHLGHCTYTESYWVREQWLQREILDEDLKKLFIPELCDKSQRGERIPAYPDLISWSQQLQRENRDLITANPDHAAHERLMQDDYLLHFLKQHYAQHYETLQMIRAQRILHAASDIPSTTAPLPAQSTDFVDLDAGEYEIGSAIAWHYDNERPVFTTHLDAFAIDTNPVSNGEYLQFMQNGGYENSILWTKAGWEWKKQNQITAPEYWRVSNDGVWLQATPDGLTPLQGEQAVYGLSYHEARAFAAWAGARLPHEYEWEAACRSGKMQRTGESWEWCDNPFHPYAGFEAFPYRGYSVPWFDDKHFTLKGGSRYSLDIIRRPTFRNYYEADKRYIFAGMRLVK